MENYFETEKKYNDTMSALYSAFATKIPDFIATRSDSEVIAVVKRSFDAGVDIATIKKIAEAKTLTAEYAKYMHDIITIESGKYKTYENSTLEKDESEDLMSYVKSKVTNSSQDFIPNDDEQDTWWNDVVVNGYNAAVTTAADLTTTVDPVNAAPQVDANTNTQQQQQTTARDPVAPTQAAVPKIPREKVKDYIKKVFGDTGGDKLGDLGNVTNVAKLLKTKNTDALDLVTFAKNKGINFGDDKTIALEQKKILINALVISSVMQKSSFIKTNSKKYNDSQDKEGALDKMLDNGDKSVMSKLESAPTCYFQDKGTKYFVVDINEAKDLFAHVRVENTKPSECSNGKSVAGDLLPGVKELFEYTEAMHDSGAFGEL
ncbi:MAG: hypothetical protein ACI8ZF_000216 [Candidatus Midichloriaceae bacterium]